MEKGGGFLPNAKGHDVIIIGAGLSGLTAAFRIIESRDDTSVLVLEAKNRVGGRTIKKELKTSTGSNYWDLGGQWIGSCQPHIMRLLADLGIGTYKQYSRGRKLVQQNSESVKSYAGDIPSLSVLSLIELQFFKMKCDRMVAKIDPEFLENCQNAEIWDNITMSEFLRQNMWSKDARFLLKAAVRTIFGADPEHISWLYFLLYAKAAGGIDPLISAKPGIGGQELRVKGCASSICTLLLHRIGAENVLLDHPVVRIKQDTDKITVQCLNGTEFTSRKVIVATPPHLTARIEFSPPLPSETFHVLQRMPVGYLIKVIVTYQTPFWRENGLSGEAVTLGGTSNIPDVDSGPLSVVYDATSDAGEAALVAFIGGKQHFQYANIELETRKSAVLRNLVQLFGIDAHSPIDYCEFNWNEEIYNGGCPVSVGVPGSSMSIGRLRQPHLNCYFAGTESATSWCGFLNGAVQSGERAAEEAMRSLGSYSSNIQLVKPVKDLKSFDKSRIVCKTLFAASFVTAALLMYRRFVLK